MAEKILVVDDEISLQETLAYNLSKEGYTVEVAGDGNQALELARSSKPCLLYTSPSPRDRTRSRMPSSA